MKKTDFLLQSSQLREVEKQHFFENLTYELGELHNQKLISDLQLSKLTQFAESYLG